MAITKPPITEPFASDPTTQADSDLFDPPSFMVQGYTAPGGNPEIPLLGHHNWLFWFAMQSARYHQSRGFPEWDVAEDQYVAPAFVQFGGAVYALVGTATTGLDPDTDPTNWIPFGGVGPWGYSATNATIAADTDLTTGHAYYRNLTIGAGKKLHMVKPGILFVSGTLTFGDAASRLYFGKPSDLKGGNASASTRGIGGIGWNSQDYGAVLGGGDGGAGGDDTHFTPGAGEAVGQNGGTGLSGGAGTACGGAAGAGGAGLHASGAAGVFSSLFTGSPVGDGEAQSLLRIILQHGWGFGRGGNASNRAAVPFGIEGGSGGGGGGGPTGPGNSAGGGGGAGGSVGLVIAKNIVVVADGNIQAPGGDGGNAFAGTVAAGGGGPGGGGFVGVAYGTKTGPALTAAVTCPAGTPGTGANGGAAGSAGSVGNVREYQLGM